MFSLFRPPGTYSFHDLLRGGDLIEKGAYLFIQKTSGGDDLFELQ